MLNYIKGRIKVMIMIIMTVFIKRMIISAHTHTQRLETAKDSSGGAENMAGLLIIMGICKALTLRLKALLLMGFKKKKKKKIFSFDLKESRRGFCRRGRGRSIHVEGPKTEKAREPKEESLVRGIRRLRVSEVKRRTREGV